MKKRWLQDWGSSFACVVLGIIIIECILRGEISKDYFNIILAFIWTGIAVITLSIYPLFEKLSTLYIILLQYGIAMGLVLLSIKLMGFAIPLHPDAYKDAFGSFTSFYIVGAAIFYVMERKSIQKQNALLENIKQLRNNNYRDEL